MIGGLDFGLRCGRSREAEAEEEHVLMVRLGYRLNNILLVEEMEGEGKVLRIREKLPQLLKLENIC